MTYEAFQDSLSQHSPHAALPTCLKALWYDAKGNWEKAHHIAQEIQTQDGSWVHAYLHRVEGDIWNANYWYRQAGKPIPDISLEQEWTDLVSHFLSVSPGLF